MADNDTRYGGGWRNRLTFPAIWLVGGLFILLLSGLSVLDEAPLNGGPDTYYSVASHAISHAAPFGVFAAIYFVLDTALDLRFSRLLGWSQFGLMFLGALLIVAPALFLHSHAMPSQFENMERAFAMLRHILTLGYLLRLASVLLFLGLLCEAVVRILRRRR